MTHGVLRRISPRDHGDGRLHPVTVQGEVGMRVLARVHHRHRYVGAQRTAALRRSSAEQPADVAGQREMELRHARRKRRWEDGMGRARALKDDRLYRIAATRAADTQVRRLIRADDVEVGDVPRAAHLGSLQPLPGDDAATGQLRVGLGRPGHGESEPTLGGDDES